MRGYPGVIRGAIGSVIRAVNVGAGQDPAVGIGPFMDFGMAIGKTEPAGLVVITGRYVHKFAGLERRGWIHIEHGVVDAVRVFVHEHP